MSLEKMALPDLVKKARTQLGELTGLGIGSTVCVRRDGQTWCVHIEVVEKKSLPDSQDILATYELALDEEGNMQNFAHRHEAAFGDSRLRRGRSWSVT